MKSGTIVFNQPKLTKNPQEDKNLYQVQINVARNIMDYDFPQAKKAWEALVEAGIEPGKLVVTALNIGQGYEIETKISPANFHKAQNLVGESQTSDKTLVGYQYKTDQNLLSSPQDQPGIVLVSQDLAEVKKGNNRFVEIYAVIKAEDEILITSSLLEE